MELKASMVVMSHLSDAQETISYNEKSSSLHINFAKYIILQSKGDLTQEIDADAMWTAYLKLHNKDIPVVLDELPSGEVHTIVTPEMYEVIKDLVITQRKKLEAVRYLREKGKERGKEITVKSCKDYIDGIEQSN